MIAKKNQKADLEKKRFAFFQIGLLVSGSLCLAAFEYSSVHDETSMIEPLEPETSTMEVEMVYEQMEQPQKQKKVIKIINLNAEVNVTKEPQPDPNAIVTKTSDGKITMDDGDDNDCIDCDYTFVDDGDDDTIFGDDFFGQEPEFPGGYAAMVSFIQDNIRLPDYIADYEQGTVYVKFVVNKDGSIEQVEIARGLSYGIDNAAMKVVKNMPKWQPGEQAGKKVRVRYTLPIRIAMN